MTYYCGSDIFVDRASPSDTKVLLYGRPTRTGTVTAGAAIRASIARLGLNPDEKAWDFLSLALSVVSADFHEKRSRSVDGWTRDIELFISVAERDLWAPQSAALESALSFLTTDRWKICFYPGGENPALSDGSLFSNGAYPDRSSVALLSGGLDSLIGAIDLSAKGELPVAVAHTVRGDGQKQRHFASMIGDGMPLMQLNHNVKFDIEPRETSQRARSFIFIAYAILVATSLQRYRSGETVPIYISENGFIALNPPLTLARVGSLSTRTVHPVYINRLQNCLDNLGIRVRLINPYSGRTKGEMLKECLNQTLLVKHATHSTSCGRFQRHKYEHCGRCLPCQIRRSAFLAWGQEDATFYAYEYLGSIADFDDVRPV